MAYVLERSPDEAFIHNVWCEVINWFWLQDELGKHTELRDTWTPSRIWEHANLTHEQSRYNLWRCHALVGVKSFRAIVIDAYPKHAFLLPKMPHFELVASIEELESKIGETISPDPPFRCHPELPMIPLSSKDVETLSNPKPFEPGEVGLDIETLNQAAAGLSNDRWFLYRVRNAGKYSNTAFVLPWPARDPERRITLPGTGCPVYDTFENNGYTVEQNFEYFAELEEDLKDPSTDWIRRWCLRQMIFYPAGSRSS